MINFTDMLVFAGMFFLRFGVPLLIVIGIGYLLKRLDRRWEAEAWAEQAKAQAAEVPAEQPAFRPRPSGPPCPHGRPCLRRCCRSSRRRCAKRPDLSRG